MHYMRSARGCRDHLFNQLVNGTPFSASLAYSALLGESSLSEGLCRAFLLLVNDF